MALDVEEVVDGRMDGEEPLRGRGRFEPLHLSLSSSHPADVNFLPDCSFAGLAHAEPRGQANGSRRRRSGVYRLQSPPARSPASSRVSASAELPPERSCGIEPGNPGLRPHCPRHARDRTASLELRRPSRPGASVRSVVAADVESAAHMPDRISRPIFELSHTRCRDHARQAGPQRPDSSA